MEETTKSESVLTPETKQTQEAQTLTELAKKVHDLQSENADLREAKKKYYDTLLNGTPVSDDTPVEEYRSAKEVREELVKTQANNTNLKNAELYVELNEAVIREGGQSVFLPRGKDVTPSYEEIELSERFPRILKECIEKAEGSPSIFNTEFQRHIRK